MNRLSIFRVAEFAGAPVSSGDGEVSVDKVSTDSRTVKRGELFVALRGENFDGHKFVESAARAGAVGAIVQRTSRSSARKIPCRRIKSSPPNIENRCRSR